MGMTGQTTRDMAEQRCCCAATMHVEYPMLFRAENKREGTSTHCGVLEFIAQEGMCYMPHWVRLRPSCTCNALPGFSTPMASMLFASLPASPCRHTNGKITYCVTLNGVVLRADDAEPEVD